LKENLKGAEAEEKRSFNTKKQCLLLKRKNEKVFSFHIGRKSVPGRFRPKVLRRRFLKGEPPRRGGIGLGLPQRTVRRKRGRRVI
jgi:hypothetical protein